MDTTPRQARTNHGAWTSDALSERVRLSGPLGPPTSDPEQTRPTNSRGDWSQWSSCDQSPSQGDFAAHETCGAGPPGSPTLSTQVSASQPTDEPARPRGHLTSSHLPAPPHRRSNKCSIQEDRSSIQEDRSLERTHRRRMTLVCGFAPVSRRFPLNGPAQRPATGFPAGPGYGSPFKNPGPSGANIHLFDLTRGPSCLLVDPIGAGPGCEAGPPPNSVRVGRVALAALAASGAGRSIQHDYDTEHLARAMV